MKALLMFIALTATPIQAQIQVQIQAQTCTPPVFTQRFLQTIPETPDHSLFTEALLTAVNFERCTAGKQPLHTQTALRKAAQIHSRNMAKTNTFNHISRAGNARTVKDRAKLANLHWRWIAENIALIPRYHFGDKIAFQVIDRAACRFANTSNGAEIPAHSYASLARTVITQWMASEAHRDNILSRYADRMGAAVEFDPAGAPCGQFYITQVFAD